MGGIDLDLASQPGDAQVDGAIERVGLAMRRDLQQPIAHHDRYGFSAKIFNRSNSLAVTRSSMPSAGSISHAPLEFENAPGDADARGPSAGAPTARRNTLLTRASTEYHPDRDALSFVFQP